MPIQDEFNAQIPDIAIELSNQMGRPVKFNHLECKTMLARADYLLNIAPTALKDVQIPDYDNSSNKRFIQRVPHGVTLVVSHIYTTVAAGNDNWSNLRLRHGTTLFWLQSTVSCQPLSQAIRSFSNRRLKHQCVFVFASH